MDGVGLNDEEKGNAFKLANTPNIDKYISKYPNTYVATSGMACWTSRRPNGKF